MCNLQDMITMQTDDFLITAGSELVDTRNNEFGKKEFVWGYYFCIENTSDEKITLLGKDWNITDSSGNSFSDDSVGFQGEIPEIEPGEYFEFSSLAPLKSPNAVFYGRCRFVKDGKQTTQNIELPILQFNVENESGCVYYS